MEAADQLLSLVEQAAQMGRESKRHLRATIVAARAAGVPLTRIAQAANLSVGGVHAIVKEEGTDDIYTPSPVTAPVPAADDVLVVAARVAYEEYLNYGAYVCQPGRSFRDVKRLGFYRLGKIEREFPEIRAIEDHVAFTRGNVERLRSTGSPVDRELADLIEKLVAHHRRDDQLVYKVFLLTPPDDPRTLTLEQPIEHVTSGRGSAWTMGQRYLGEAALLRNPTTTDDL